MIMTSFWTAMVGEKMGIFLKNPQITTFINKPPKVFLTRYISKWAYIDKELTLIKRMHSDYRPFSGDMRNSTTQLTILPWWNPTSASFVFLFVLASVQPILCWHKMVRKLFYDFIKGGWGFKTPPPLFIQLNDFKPVSCNLGKNKIYCDENLSGFLDLAP